MKPTALFDCRFSSCQAAGTPQARTSTGPQVVMAEAMTVDEAGANPSMPHVSLSSADLDRRYPAVTVPPAADADDGNDLGDATLCAGIRQVKDLVHACAEQGRGRRLEVHSSSRSVTPRVLDWFKRGAADDLPWRGPSVGL